MSRLVDFSNGKALMVNNGDWLRNLNYIEFLRDIGVHFSVNRMLAAECYKARLERGLTFFELNYMVMQSYDFLVLNREYGCTVQLGGDDQWSNIIGGVELIRRADRRDAFGMTFALLLTGDGRKMGKTEKGAVWLDPEKTSPYEFFQYWRSIDDADVLKCVKMLTFIPLWEIAEFERLRGSELNSVKERLAFEVTKLIHGETAANKALAAAKAVFSGAESADMPVTEIPATEFEIGILAVDLLLRCGLIASKSEGRRLIDQGGVTVGDKKVAAFDERIDAARFENGSLIIKKGKKVFHKVSLTPLSIDS
jgi:tyrosyl-tRNA synthetase